MDGAESSSTIAAVSTTLADLSLVTRDAPPSTRQPVLPWDLLYLIAQFATEAGDSEWQRTEFEVAKLDEGAGGSGSRELKVWREHYTTCCALSLSCRFLHTVTIPRLWRRVAILKKMSSTWLADLAKTTSLITAHAGEAPLKPFGLYTRELTLYRLLRPTDGQAATTHLKAFHPVFPNLEDLCLGPFLEERYPLISPALGSAWPRLKSLRRIPRMAPGSSGRFADELARLPCLEHLSVGSGSALNSRAIEALRLNTMLVNPLTGRPSTGLTSLLLGAGVIRDEATLFQVLSACPNLIKLHIAGAGSQMRWSSLDLTRFLDRLNPKLIHLGFRPYGPVLGSLRHVLRRLPRLEYLSVRPSHVDFDLFIHAETSQLRHLELRDAATDVNVAAGPAGVAQAEQSLVDEGFSWSSKSMIALGSRRALEAARSGFALDRNLVLRLSSVVTIEAAILAEEGGRGVEKVGTGCATTIEADEADEAAVAQALTMED